MITQSPINNVRICLEASFTSPRVKRRYSDSNAISSTFVTCCTKYRPVNLPIPLNGAATRLQILCSCFLKICQFKISLSRVDGTKVCVSFEMLNQKIEAVAHSLPQLISGILKSIFGVSTRLTE